MTEDTRPRAEKIQAHITLLTKDGRKIGNAFIIAAVNDPEIQTPTWLVQTEFGSRLRLSENEITEQFYLGYVDTPGHYFENQLHKLMKNAGLRYLLKAENRYLANEEFGKVVDEIENENAIRQKLNLARRVKAKPKQPEKKKTVVAKPKNKTVYPKDRNAIFEKVFTQTRRIAA